MLSHKELTDAGYLYHNNAGATSHADGFFQKKFSDAVGVLYTVEIYVYDNREYKKRFINNNAMHDYAYEAHTHMKDKYDNIFNLQKIGADSDSVESIELFFKETYTLLGCQHYKIEEIEWNYQSNKDLHQ